MTHPRPAALLLIVTLVWFLGGKIKAQNAPNLAKAKPRVLFLDRSNTGQEVAVPIGQAIELRLQTIGGGQYQDPQITGSAIRFEGSAFAKPADQNPGGPKQYYHFRATEEGEAKIRIPHSGSNAAFTVTVHVKKGPKP